jgi:hypothetical protein
MIIHRWYLLQKTTSNLLTMVLLQSAWISKTIEKTWPISMRIALRMKWPVESVTSTLELFFGMQALLKKQGGYVDTHYVKTSNRSRSICNGPLTPITSHTSVMVVVWHPLPISAQDEPEVSLHNTHYQCGLLVTGFLNASYINSS